MSSLDERLFERFRTRGDAQALGELFDRTAPALLRIALHLARDPAAAEDLLQGTFLRAIEVREQWDPQRPLLPWLCGLLHNRARHERWQRERSPDPARLRAASPVDPARAAQHAEFDAAVDAAITGLPEVYRAVLRLHLAYGHAPAEIAHALDRPAGTVRSQLARGLDLLRKVLPAGFTCGAALSLTSGRGLAAVKLAVLEHATVAGPVAVATAFAGVLMKKFVAAAAVLIATGVWFAWPRPEVAPNLAQVPAAASLATELVPRSESPAATTQQVRERSAATEPAPASTGSLRVTCRWADDGSPAWGVLVTVRPAGLRDSGLLQRAVRTGDDSSVLVADLPASKTYVEGDRGGAAEVFVTAGTTTDAELRIPAGIQVHGRVVDDAGAPVPTAQIWLSEGKHNYCDGSFVAKVDQAGQFFLRSVEPERFLSATAPGCRSAIVQPVRGEVGTTLQVELVLRGSGASLFGKVLDPNGVPVKDGRVFVGYRELGFRWSREMFGEHRPPIESRTAADGTFAVHGLAPGSKQPVWVRTIGCCVWYELVQLESAGDTTVTVQLQAGASLTGRATDATNQPIAGAYVGYMSTAWFSARADFHEFHGPSWSHYGAPTDGDGRYRIDCITPGTLRLRANKDEMEVRGEVEAVADGTATWDPVLAEVVIRGRVVDERDAALANVDVTAMAPRGQGNMASATTDADGRFMCRQLAHVPYVLSFYVANDRVRARPAAMVFGVEPGADEVLVRLADAALPTCTITGTLLDQDGRAPAEAEIRCSSTNLRWEPTTPVDAATGAFHIGPLPAGTWRLQASVGTRRSAWNEPFVLAVGETRDVGVMQMPATGSIRLHATGPDGASLDGEDVALEGSTGWSETAWLVGKIDGDELRIDAVAPGEYRIRLGGAHNLPTVYERVTVVAGEVAQARIAVPKGIGVQLVLSPVSEPAPIHETFVWLREGTLFERYENWWEGNGERTWRRRLLPGTYELTITSETGKREQNTFVIAPGDPDGRTIPIKLP